MGDRKCSDICPKVLVLVSHTFLCCRFQHWNLKKKKPQISQLIYYTLTQAYLQNTIIIPKLFQNLLILCYITSLFLFSLWYFTLYAKNQVFKCISAPGTASSNYLLQPVILIPFNVKQRMCKVGPEPYRYVCQWGFTPSCTSAVAPLGKINPVLLPFDVAGWCKVPQPETGERERKKTPRKPMAPMFPPAVVCESYSGSPGSSLQLRMMSLLALQRNNQWAECLQGPPRSYQPLSRLFRSSFNL